MIQINTLLNILKIVYCFDCGEPAFCGNVIEENSNVQKTKFSLTAKDVNKNKTYKTRCNFNK